MEGKFNVKGYPRDEVHAEISMVQAGRLAPSHAVGHEDLVRFTNDRTSSAPIRLSRWVQVAW